MTMESVRVAATAERTCEGPWSCSATRVARRQQGRALSKSGRLKAKTASRWPDFIMRGSRSITRHSSIPTPPRWSRASFLRSARRAPHATSSLWCLPGPATRLSAPAAIPRNTPNITPAIRRNIAAICGCSTTWCPPSSACDKPVICRVNGMRIGGGQEIGMACDFSVAQDLARFGQAGPKHGSAPIGGATDFLPVMVGAERAMASCVLCEPFSAHEAYFMGMLAAIAPALKVDGAFVANPLVETGRITDEYGRIVFGKPKTGEALKAGQELMKRGTVDLSLLDQHDRGLCARSFCTHSPTARRRRSRNCASPSSTPGIATRRIRAPGSRST